MNVGALAWGLAWLAAAAVVGLGALPGSDGWGMGPRVGLTVLLGMLGATVALAGNAAWFLGKTTRPEDYEGGCPVGARCACGVFNMSTRKTCKGCKAALVAPGRPA